MTNIYLLGSAGKTLSGGLDVKRGGDAIWMVERMSKYSGRPLLKNVRTLSYVIII